uniref:Uncharacterized protein n=1 Tax=Timema tahoe TaxID=61484 RepID=A0A7R9IIK9_9NEOP|nr:unnamed protein product [Timema tahoe]
METCDISLVKEETVELIKTETQNEDEFDICGQQGIKTENESDAPYNVDGVVKTEMNFYDSCEGIMKSTPDHFTLDNKYQLVENLEANSPPPSPVAVLLDVQMEDEEDNISKDDKQKDRGQKRRRKNKKQLKTTIKESQNRLKITEKRMATYRQQLHRSKNKTVTEKDKTPRKLVRSLLVGQKAVDPHEEFTVSFLKNYVGEKFVFHEKENISVIDMSDIVQVLNYKQTSGASTSTPGFSSLFGTWRCRGNSGSSTRLAFYSEQFRQNHGLGWLQLVLYPGRADKTRALPKLGRRGERGRANSRNIIAYCDSASDVSVLSF